MQRLERSVQEVYRSSATTRTCRSDSAYRHGTVCRQGIDLSAHVVRDVVSQGRSVEIILMEDGVPWGRFWAMHVYLYPDIAVTRPHHSQVRAVRW